MTGIELYVDDIAGRLHAAVVEKAGLFDLYTDPLNRSAAWGAIYVGRVAKIDKRLDAAIVDLGQGLQGFLPAKHVHLPGGDQSESRSGIGDLLKPGQMIFVQIKAEAKRGSEHEQHKLPRLTTQIYLMGHHLVYCPVANPVTMSRMIERKDVLGMTANLHAPGGWILQPQAEQAEAETLREEAEKLIAEWQVILGVKAESTMPALLKGGPNALYRVLHDYGAEVFDHIYCGSRPVFDMMREWCQKYAPALATSKRLRAFRAERHGEKLFDAQDIYGEIADLSSNRVDLRSGGSLIIDTTHALVVIDVNQGSAPDPVTTNNEAAAECARQLRLRNLSGAILVDFIGLEEHTKRAKLVDLVEETLKNDPAGAIAHGFTRLGIMEITRRRRTAWLSEKTDS